VPRFYTPADAAACRQFDGSGSSAVRVVIIGELPNRCHFRIAPMSPREISATTSAPFENGKGNARNEHGKGQIAGLL